MAIISRAFRSAPSLLPLCLSLLLLCAACTWHGIRPVGEQIKLTEQARLALAVVLADPVGSHDLHHWETTVATTLLRRPDTEYVPCEAVEKILQVRQVLKGSVAAGSLLNMTTYEFKIKGIPHMSSQPAIFFLTRVGNAWTPFTDFGTNSIVLQGFPHRPLKMARASADDPMPWLAFDHALIDALLDPQNAADWPMFPTILSRLVSVSGNIAFDSGSGDALVIDRLSALLKTGNPGVVKQARKEIIDLTNLCLEASPVAQTWARVDARRHFLTPGPHFDGVLPDSDDAYWHIKLFTCSNVPPVRAKAEALLRQYFPDRRTVGCEICAAQ